MGPYLGGLFILNANAIPRRPWRNVWSFAAIQDSGSVVSETAVHDYEIALILLRC